MLGCRWAAYEAKEVHEVGYTNLIGEPLWPSRNTAPGIAAGIGLLSKCVHRPSWGAWYSALHLLHSSTLIAMREFNLEVTGTWNRSAIMTAVSTKT